MKNNDAYYKAEAEELAKEAARDTLRAEGLFLRGKYRRYFEQVTREYENKNVGPRLIEESGEMLVKLFNEYNFKIIPGIYNDLRTQSDIIPADSGVFGTIVNIIPDATTRRHEFNLCLRVFALKGGYLNMKSRNLPISFIFDHVHHRHIQRTNEAMGPTDLSASMPYAMMMIRILEEKMHETKSTVLPMVIPTEKGFFLGILRQAKMSDYSNQINVYKVTQGDFSWSRYSWVPNSKFEIRTFIGLNEMKPDQLRLHAIMKKYALKNSSPESLEINRSVSDYMLTQGCMLRDIFKRSDAFLTIEQNMRSLIASKLWKDTVRFPFDIASNKDPRFLIG